MKTKQIIMIVITIIILSGCSGKEDYGVFLSLDNSNLEIFTIYDTVVIDAQYFSKEDIEFLHENDVKVLSYFNVGSIENFRDYYEDFEYLTLGIYENWEEEKWVDVSAQEWQDFICGTIAKELYEKGIDGFFVDNCDVYYNYNNEEIYQGLVNILGDICNYDKDVVINGGDKFVTRYIEENAVVDGVLTGVNQEEVFSKYDFDSGTSIESSSEDREYYQNYLEKCKIHGADIYLIEYTNDTKIINEVEKYCNEKGFKYYIADSIELN